MSMATVAVLAIMLWWAGVSFGQALIILLVTAISDIIAHAIWAAFEK